MGFKEIELNYGKNPIKLQVPEDRLLWSLTPQQYKSDSRASELLKRALTNPLGTNRLSEKAKVCEDALIVVDDITRPTPQHKILPLILEELETGGISRKNITILVALGTHKKMTEKQLKNRLGTKICESVNIIQHDYQDKTNLVNLGKTKNEIPVQINKRYCLADLKIAVGNVVPHVNAGWAGGAKIILPGICGKETVDMFHFTAAFNLHQIQGKVDNVVRRDMEEITKMVGLDFLLNTVLDHDNNIIAIAAGDYKKAHRKAVSEAEVIFASSIQNKADVTVVSSYPADLDLWQASKAVTMASQATKPNGTIILISPCYDGIAPDHPVVRKLGLKGASEVYRMVKSGDINDITGASILMEIAKIREKYNLGIYSEGINKNEAAEIGIEKINVIQDKINRFLEKTPEAELGFINMGAELLPQIKPMKK